MNADHYNHSLMVCGPAWTSGGCASDLHLSGNATTFPPSQGVSEALALSDAPEGEQMRQDEPRNHLDASDLLFEVGRQLQAVALVMRKHEIAPHQVCECGRVAVRMLPVFGLRC